MTTIRIALALAAVTAVMATAATSSVASRGSAAQSNDIVDTAVAAGNFTTLAKLLTRAGLVGTLKEPGPYTVFAPTDAAFARLPAGKLNALKRNKARLKAVLLYRGAAGSLPAADIVQRSSVKTLNGKRVLSASTTRTCS